MTDKLERSIRDRLVEFHWGNFGLDEVENAETEWADALARGLRAGMIAEITDEMVQAVWGQLSSTVQMDMEGREYRVRYWLRAALEAAGFTVAPDGGDAA